MNFEILKLSFLVLANVENNGYIKCCELNMWDFGFSIILGILFAKLISISLSCLVHVIWIFPGKLNSCYCLFKGSEIKMEHFVK